MPGTELQILSHHEAEALVELEATIEAGLRSFVEVGSALLKIKEGHLYRSTYGTFESYCQGRWGFGRAYGDRIVMATRVAEQLTAAGLPAPETVHAAFPLASLPEAERAEAWQEANASGKATHRKVKAIVDARKGQSRVNGVLQDDPDDIAEQRAAGKIPAGVIVDV